MNESGQESDHVSIPASSANSERLRWCSWPCAKCNGSLTPIGLLRHRLETSPDVWEKSPEEIRDFQIRCLQEWISGCSHNGRKERVVLRLDEGSEHQVFFEPANGRVIKLTRRGIFGESYYLVNNIIHQKNCSPLECLLRLRTWKKLFVSAPEALGITEHGQIVSIQNFISGEEPTQQEVDEFLTASLFMPAKQNFLAVEKTFGAV